jgi:hypothetical protein
VPRRTQFPWYYLILGLAAIGLISRLVHSPTSFIIPVLVIGLVWYFYKAPPRWFIRRVSPSRPRASKKPPKKKRKKHRFQVINGNKK